MSGSDSTSAQRSESEEKKYQKEKELLNKYCTSITGKWRNETTDISIDWTNSLLTITNLPDNSKRVLDLENTKTLPDGTTIESSYFSEAIAVRTDICQENECIETEIIMVDQSELHIMSIFPEKPATKLTFWRPDSISGLWEPVVQPVTTLCLKVANNQIYVDYRSRGFGYSVWTLGAKRHNIQFSLEDGKIVRKEFWGVTGSNVLSQESYFVENDMLVNLIGKNRILYKRIGGAR